MEIKVSYTMDEYGTQFQRLWVDDVFQGKVGPIAELNDQQITCEQISLMLQKAWDAGRKGEPCVPIESYEERPDEK